MDFTTVLQAVEAADPNRFGLAVDIDPSSAKGEPDWLIFRNYSRRDAARALSVAVHPGRGFALYGGVPAPDSGLELPYGEDELPAVVKLIRAWADAGI